MNPLIGLGALLAVGAIVFWPKKSKAQPKPRGASCILTADSLAVWGTAKKAALLFLPGVNGPPPIVAFINGDSAWDIVVTETDGKFWGLDIDGSVIEVPEWRAEYCSFKPTATQIRLTFAHRSSPNLNPVFFNHPFFGTVKGFPLSER